MAPFESGNSLRAGNQEKEQFFDPPPTRSDTSVLWESVGARVADNRAPITSIEPITGERVNVRFREMDGPSREGSCALIAWWRAITEEKGNFVMGRDVPARPIAKFTKHLQVFEPVDGGENFRYRVVGSVLSERIGRDVTGLLVTEVYADEAAAHFVRILNKVIATGTPAVQEAQVVGRMGVARRAEGVLLPMRSPDLKEIWILTGAFYW